MVDEQEYEALNNILHRLASTRDSALESVLDKVLPRLIARMDTTSEHVKLMEIFQHLNRRLELLSRSHKVILPVATMSLNYCNSSLKCSTILLYYMEMGFPGMDVHEQAGIVQNLWKNVDVAVHPTAQLSVMLWFWLSLLGRTSVEELEHPLLASLATKCWILKSLEFIIAVKGNCEQEATPIRQIVLKYCSTDTQLNSLKLAILAFLSSTEILSKNEVFLSFILGSGDNYDVVRESAQDCLKRVGKPDTLSQFLVSGMCSIYLQSGSGIALKMLILSEFVRYETVAVELSGQDSYRIAFDAIFSTTVIRLQIAGIGYLQSIIKYGDSSSTERVAPVLLAKLLSLLKSVEISASKEKLRQCLYGPVAMLCHFVPQVSTNGMQLVKFFFGRLDSESPTVQACVLEAITMHLYKIFIRADVQVLQELKTYLLLAGTSYQWGCLVESQSVSKWRQRAALKWICELYSFADCESRLYSCFLLDEVDPDIVDLAQKSLLPQLVGVCLSPYPQFGDFVQFTHNRLDQFTDLGGRLSPITFSGILVFCRKCWIYQVTVLSNIPSDEALISFMKLLVRSFDQSAFRGKSIVDLETTGAEILFGMIHDPYSTHCFMYIWEQLGLDWVIKFTRSPRIELREVFASLLGEYVRLGLVDMKSLLHRFGVELEECNNTPDYYRVHGCMLCLGYLLKEGCARIPYTTKHPIVSSIVHNLGNADPLLSAAASKCLAIFAGKERLPLSSSSQYTRYDAVGRLLKLVKEKSGGNDLNAIAALRAICVGIGIEEIPDSDDNGILVLILGGMLGMVWVKDVSTSMLVCTVLVDAARVATVSINGATVLDFIFHKILNDILPRSSKLVKSNACLWLLSCLYEFRDHAEEFSTGIISIHRTFLELLDQGSVTREAASKGLSICYSISNSTVRSRMLLDLELGLNSTTGLDMYRELFDVARDLGNGALVYPMLDLSRHDPIWTGRFSRISNEKFISMVRDTGNIVRVYMYRFDTNPMVRSLMRLVWDDRDTSLIPHVKSNLVVGLSTSTNCRSRGMCLEGIGELVTNFGVWDGVWEHVLNSFEDEAESVRVIARVVGAKVVKVMIRENYEGMIELVISGLQGWGTERKKFCVGVVLQLAQERKEQLIGYVDIVVKLLLELLSESEPLELSYVMFHVENGEKEDVERARVAMSRSSDIANAIGNCVKIVNIHNVEDVVSQVSAVVRSGTGLVTLDAALRLLKELLFTYKISTTLCWKLVETVWSRIHDQSRIVQESSVETLGILCKYIRSKKLEDLVDRITKLYLQGRETEQRCLAGEIVHSIIKHNGTNTLVVSTLLPLVVLAELDVNAGHTWSLIWSESDISKLSVMDKWRGSINDFSLTALRGPVYQVRSTGVACLAKYGVGAESIFVLMDTLGDWGDARVISAISEILSRSTTDVDLHLVDSIVRRVLGKPGSLSIVCKIGFNYPELTPLIRSMYKDEAMLCLPKEYSLAVQIWGADMVDVLLNGLTLPRIDDRCFAVQAFSVVIGDVVDSRCVVLDKLMDLAQNDPFERVRTSVLNVFSVLIQDHGVGTCTEYIQRLKECLSVQLSKDSAPSTLLVCRKLAGFLS